jgi:hypothetical protein
MKLNDVMIVVGAHPDTVQEIEAALLIINILPVDFTLIGLDAVDKCKYDALYFATYHPDDIIPARANRKVLNLNIDYKTVSFTKRDDVDIVVPYKPPSGSSSLLGTLHAIQEG